MMPSPRSSAALVSALRTAYNDRDYEASLPPLPMPCKVNADGFRKDAQIVPWPKKCRTRLTDTIKRDCRDLMRATFKATSDHATAKEAAKHGVPMSVAARILAQETTRVDLANMLPVFARAAEKRIPIKIAGLVFQIIGESK